MCQTMAWESVAQAEEQGRESKVHSVNERPKENREDHGRTCSEMLDHGSRDSIEHCSDSSGSCMAGRPTR